jgi:antitoxin VapB
MALNIKNEQTVALARQLADATGETLTEAIRRSLEERLQRLEREEGHEARVERLMAMAEQLGRELGPYGAGMTTDDLYDPETGLPV